MVRRRGSRISRLLYRFAELCSAPAALIRSAATGNRSRKWMVAAAILAIALPAFLVKRTFSAPAPVRGEYEVKAAYLFNFARFVQWPADSDSKTNAFFICVLGHDPFDGALDSTIDGEKIDGRQVLAERIVRIAHSANCRVLFISASESDRLDQILSKLNGSKVLTVSDMPNFIERGGMIQLVIENQHVRFEINTAAAQRVGLKLSSQLVKLAINVRRTP